MIKEQVWQALVCGIVVEMTGDEQAVTVVARGLSRSEVIRMVDIAWNRGRLWPHSEYQADCEFQLRESAPDQYSVTLWASKVVK